MAFPVPIASALTGASERQLAYWRRATASAPPLLVPEGKRQGRFLYSWADVVALRAIVYLRAEKSLHRIRRAVELVRALDSDQWTHLAQYRLLATRSTIVIQTPSGQMLDAEAQPGTILSRHLMADVLDSFATRTGATVPPLERPRPALSVDPRVLGGYPVISGTRVPFDLVAGLAEDGVSPDGITEIYPSVDGAAVPDAVDFARQVAAAA